MINKDSFDFGFVILHTQNKSHVISTIKSLAGHYPTKPRICVLPQNLNNLMHSIGEHIQTFEAGNNLTSLINEGIKRSEKEWNFFVFSGYCPNFRMHKVFQNFISDYKDIMFPVIDRQWGFVESNLNGLLINKKAIQEVGYFDEKQPNLNYAKLKWALNALRLKYRFKAIHGVKY